MNTVQKFLTGLLLLTLTQTTQPISQLALDKALGTCYSALKQAVSNNPWAAAIGLGTASLIAATCYKPYTIITLKDNVLEKDTFRTFDQLKKAYVVYASKGHVIIHCFYKNQRYAIHNDKMLLTLEPKTPAQLIKELKTEGVLFCDLSSFCLGTYRLVKGFDELTSDLAMIRKKIKTRKTHPNIDKKFFVFRYALENNDCDFKLFKTFNTKQEADEFVKNACSPKIGCDRISTPKEENAGYYFLLGFTFKLNQL